MYNKKEDNYMKSTDMNINNPLNVERIDLQRNVDLWKSPRVEVISSFLYDRLNVKDPMTVYVTDNGNVYLGEMLIEKDEISCKYLLGMDNDEYIILMNLRQMNQNRLIPIARFEDINTAVDVLHRYNKVKSHRKISLSIYTALSAYIDKFVGIGDLILSIMVLYGYKNDPRLQKVIHVYSEYHENNDVSMAALFLTNLPSFARAYNNPLFDYYNEIYKVIEKYKFFKEEKYNKGELTDLSSAVSDIENIMSRYSIDVN